MPKLVYPRFVGRAIAHDVAFPFRMGAGFPGDITRTHPVTVEANKQHATTPVLGFGYAAILDPTTASVRQVAATDTALVDIYGISVRFWPGQANLPPAAPYGQQPLGSIAVPPGNQPIDILRAGYILVPVVGVVRKGDPVFLWVAASGGGHIQGAFEAAASAGNTAALSAKSMFGSGPDANGVAELQFNV